MTRRQQATPIDRPSREAAAEPGRKGPRAPTRPRRPRAQPAPAPTSETLTRTELDNTITYQTVSTAPEYIYVSRLPEGFVATSPSKNEWVPSLQERRLLYTVAWGVVVLLLAWIGLTAWIVWLIR